MAIIVAPSARFLRPAAFLLVLAAIAGTGAARARAVGPRCRDYEDVVHAARGVQAGRTREAGRGQPDARTAVWAEAEALDANDAARSGLGLAGDLRRAGGLVGVLLARRRVVVVLPGETDEATCVELRRVTA